MNLIWFFILGVVRLAWACVFMPLVVLPVMLIELGGGNSDPLTDFALMMWLDKRRPDAEEG